MKLVNCNSPLYIIEIPFLITQTLNYESKGLEIFDHTQGKIDEANRIFPGFFEQYENLLKQSSMILKDHPEIKKIHRSETFGSFVDLMYNAETFDFEDIDLTSFSISALVTMLIKFMDIDLDNLDEVDKIRISLIAEGSIQYKLLFDQVNNLEIDNEKKYHIIEYFYKIDAIFEEYKNVYYKLLEIYLKFSKSFSISNDNFQFPVSIKDINLEGAIDIDSFKNQTSGDFFYSYSLILYNGTSAKVAMNKEGLSFSMKGILYDIFVKYEEENRLSITNIETQISALGDSKRMTIFTLLLKKEYYLKELAEALGLSSSTLSHHMEILLSARLVTIRAKGKKTYYRINPNEIRRISRFFEDVLDHLGEIS